MKLRSPFLVWIVTILGSGMAVKSLPAQDTNTAEIIRQLQKRIDDLEQKVKALEGNKAGETSTNAAASSDQIRELDQKLKILERNRELEQEAAEAKAKEEPKISIGD